ncbi:MAG: Nudix family hydrolase [Methylophilaceae bacterium]
MTAIIHAAVAVLQRPSGEVLLAQRPAGKAWSGWWEFPGGKIESGETAAQALVRELQEELGMQVVQASPWLTRTHQYPEKTVRLHFFKVREWLGDPQSLEQQAWSWQNPNQLTVDPLLPANQPIMQALRLPSVMAISNVAELGESLFLQRLQTASSEGLRLLQLREPQLNKAQLLQLFRQVEAIKPNNARIVLNADAELAIQAGCGLHLNSQRLMQLQQRPIIAADQLCSASCHNADELQKAWDLQLDYALLSPVQATLSHPQAQPLGWSKFSQLIQDTPIPIYALGGMRKQDLHVAWQAGAHGIAMQRGLFGEK